LNKNKRKQITFRTGGKLEPLLVAEENHWCQLYLTSPIRLLRIGEGKLFRVSSPSLSFLCDHCHVNISKTVATISWCEHSKKDSRTEQGTKD